MLMYFFSQTGDYQKAFEHLGNVLTYDPGNYKVWWGVEMHQLNHEGTPPKANSTVRALPSASRAWRGWKGSCPESFLWNTFLGSFPWVGSWMCVEVGKGKEAEYGMLKWSLWFLIWSCTKARWNLLWKEDLLDFKNPGRTVPGPLWSKWILHFIILPSADTLCFQLLCIFPWLWPGKLSMASRFHSSLWNYFPF